MKRETACYVKLPQIIDFTDKDGNDLMQEEIQTNYERIRQEVRQQLVEDEITCIKNDPKLQNLLKHDIKSSFDKRHNLFYYSVSIIQRFSGK